MASVMSIYHRTGHPHRELSEDVRSVLEAVGRATPFEEIMRALGSRDCVDVLRLQVGLRSIRSRSCFPRAARPVGTVCRVRAVWGGKHDARGRCESRYTSHAPACRLGHHRCRSA